MISRGAGALTNCSPEAEPFVGIAIVVAIVLIYNGLKFLLEKRKK